MAGSTDRFVSNIDLPLSSTPQGVYDINAQVDMEEHFNSTQTLSTIISEAFTVKVLFLTAIPAGKFVTVDVSAGEAIGILAQGAGTIAVGFLKQDVAPGEYGIIWTRGYNKNLTGLIPGTKYQALSGGDVSPYTFGSDQFYAGFAITSTILVVQNIGIM